MTGINKTLQAIKPVDKSLQPQIQAHLDDLTKPPGSLGRLEELAMQYCLISNTVKPVIGKKKIFCFAGDHGVADEGVSAFPKEVTPQMVMNMLGGGAAINVLSNHAGIKLCVVDMGVADPLSSATGLIRHKIRNGTDNIAKGPAMTIHEATQAIETGIDLAKSAQADGVTLIGTGDMGIANTTPSTALFHAYLDLPVDRITGRGTGIDNDGLQNKTKVIERAIFVNKHLFKDPLSIMAAVGGFEIAGICGLILGAAECRIPVVVDGFISSAGATAAIKMNPHVADYLFFSHMSHEAGHRMIMKELNIRPILDLDMRLGEGTGAALAMMIIESAVKIYNEMATFSSAGVSNKEE